MEHGETSLRRRGLHGALANKRAADARASALVQIIGELRAAGIISRPALAHELNRRGIPTTHGGKWHTNTVVRMLNRLGLLTPGKGGKVNNGQAGKQVADTRAKKLAPTIRALQAKGVISFDAIARELNQRKVPSALGGRWHAASVKRLLERLDRLDRA
jgi:Recombinase